MDFVRALTFVTEDPRWKEKVAIGTGVVLISSILSAILIGVLGFIILMGYSVRLMQNVRDGQQYPLPEWNDWGGDLTRGFKLFVVTLVWGLPIVLLVLPSSVGGVMADSDSGFLRTFGLFTLFSSYCLIVIYAIFITLMTPGFTIWFARDEQISSGLRFTEIVDWSRNHMGEVVLYTIAYIIASMLFSMIAGIVGVILCLVGLIVTIPLSTLVLYLYQYNLLGQIAHKDRTGEPYYRPAPVPAPAPAAPVAPPPASPPTEPDQPAQPEE